MRRSTNGSSAEIRSQRPPKLKAFKHIWLYLAGVAFSVILILAFFTLNPTAETPPFP
jgi:hypothetical protein